MSLRPYRFLAATACLGALSGAPALAAPLEDPKHTLTIQLENDSVRPGSDAYYTNGMRIAYTSPTGQMPGWLASLGRGLLGEGQQRFALELSQNMYTPFQTQLANPPANDRPYAAVLMGTLSLIQDTDTSRTVLGLGLGVIGPAALGKEVQNSFHGLLSQTSNRGWGTQLGNQPVIQLTAERTWRVSLGQAGGIEADVLPSIGAGAGTFRIYAQGGGTVRIGQGLQSDFGAPRVRPGLTGTDAYAPTLPFAWYLFAGVNGQAVAWDETLDGLPFSGNSRRVTANTFVGEAQFGVTAMAWGARLTLMHVLRSHEFRNQRNGTFQFSSASVSVKF